MSRDTKILKEFDSRQFFREVFIGWRCVLCNHVYLGNEKPDRCPHCGVRSGQWMVRVEKYEEPNLSGVSEDDKGRVRKALEMEVLSEAFYRRIEEETDNVKVEGYFRRIARHEGYHKDYLAELLQEDTPDLPTDFGFAFPSGLTDQIKKAKELEQEAFSYYTESLEVIEHPRAFELFQGFYDVEFEHLNIFDLLLSLL